jgi:hypothetical protein
MEKDTLFTVIAVMTGILIIIFGLTIYLWPVIRFAMRYRRRQKGMEENWRKIAIDLHDELEIFTQQSSVRAFIFEPVLRPMLYKLHREGYQ